MIECIEIYAFSITSGHKKAIELLIEKGANVNAVEKTWNMTPLHFIALFDRERNEFKNWTEDDSLSNFTQNFKFFRAHMCGNSLIQ